MVGKLEANILQISVFLTAFVAASSNQTKKYMAQLEGFLNDSTGKVRDAFIFMMADCKHWLTISNDLLASCILASKRVGIIVEKFRMNQEGAKEDILVLTERINTTLNKVKNEYLELLGAGVYHKTMDYTKEIMKNPEKLTNLSEMDDLLKDLNEMEVFVGKERTTQKDRLVKEVAI